MFWFDRESIIPGNWVCYYSVYRLRGGGGGGGGSVCLRVCMCMCLMT